MAQPGQYILTASGKVWRVWKEWKNLVFVAAKMYLLFF